MSSTTAAALGSGIALVVGTLAGALLTGFFTVNVKKRKRVQQRRAEVYVDLLAWIGARMPWLSEQADLGRRSRTDSVAPAVPQTRLDDRVGLVIQAPEDTTAVLGGSPAEFGETAENGQLTRKASADLAVLDGQAQPGGQPATSGTKKRTTYPDPRAMLDGAITDPDTLYFVSLRARVAVFASHDMARAFDNWVDAYRLVLQYGAGHCCKRHSQPKEGPARRTVDPPADCGSSGLRAIAYDLSTGRHKRTENTAGDSRRYKTTRWFWLKTRVGRRHDVPDGLPGYLTKAVELCASEELRKG